MEDKCIESQSCPITLSLPLHGAISYYRMVLFFFVNKISFPEGEAQKASCAFTRTRTGNKKRQEPQKTAPVAFLFAVSFYGSITLKVFSNLEAYASRRFRTVASPLICT